MEFLQTFFYTMAIIFMTLGTVVFLFILYILWKAEKEVERFKKNTAVKVASFIQEHKTQAMGAVGAGVLSFIVNRMKKKFERE